MVFVASRGDAYSGDIAIDDIRVTTGACRWNSDAIIIPLQYVNVAIFVAAFSSCDISCGLLFISSLSIFLTFCTTWWTAVDGQLVNCWRCPAYSFSLVDTVFSIYNKAAYTLRNSERDRFVICPRFSKLWYLSISQKLSYRRVNVFVSLVGNIYANVFLRTCIQLPDWWGPTFFVEKAGYFTPGFSKHVQIHGKFSSRIEFEKLANFSCMGRISTII